MPFLPPFQTPAVIHLNDIPPGERDAMLRGLMGHTPRFAPAQIWDGGRLFETSSAGIKELDQSLPPLRFGQPPRDMAWQFDFDVVDGAAYAWGWGENWASGQKGRDLQELRHTLYIYRNGGARWELWDTLQTTPEGFIGWMRPLEGGGYLLGGRFNDEEMHRADPFALAQRNGHGRLVIHDSRDADLGAPAFVWGRPSQITGADESQAYNYDRPRWMHNPKLIGAYDALLGAFSHQFRVPGHLILVGRHLGFFIVVSSRTGRVERVARLFEGLPDDAMTTPEAYEYGVLGVQPRADGHLLIAARSAEAVAQSRTWAPDLPPPEPVRLSFSEAFGKSAEDQGDLLEAKQDAANAARMDELAEARLRVFPDLVWWDFDPDTGTFRREPPPEGVPSKFPSCAALQAFSFRFKPDGNLEITPKEWK